MPPTTSCHAVDASTPTSGFQRFPRTNPNEDAVIAAKEAATPVQWRRPAPPRSISPTPPRPSTAPAVRTRVGRSRTTSQATSASATGAVAITVDAMLDGRLCAAW